MGRNARRRKAAKEFARGLAAGLENRNRSGGYENPSKEYRSGRRAGDAERLRAMGAR